MDRTYSHSHISQLIPGHEAIGTVVEMGKNVTGFELGDRCVADVGITVSIQNLAGRNRITNE